MKIAIVGAGATGLFISSYLKRKYNNIDITLFEKNKGLGRKLLATGNGKCNFMNYKASPNDYNNKEFIANLFENVSKEMLINYFDSIGLLFKFDNEGRMYPLSESSNTVLSLFTNELDGVNILLEHIVTSISYKNDKPVIDGQVFDYVVLASGSNASIDLKKTDYTYSYLEPLNLKFVRTRPSLVGLKTDMNLKLLDGLRQKVVLNYNDEVNNYFEKGEVIFKEDGLSGICVMNASFYYHNTPSTIVLDLIPSISNEELKIKIGKRFDKGLSYCLTGICHPKMIDYIRSLKISDIDSIASLLKSFKINIIGTYDMKSAQVSKGGISISEINNDFTLKKYSRIFVGGELLDIDGKCGGYNLGFAFLSGLRISLKLGEIYENKNK